MSTTKYWGAQEIRKTYEISSENIEKVERGEEPMGLVRDPAKNTPYIAFRRERESKKMLQSGYVPGDQRADRFAWASAETATPAGRG